VTEVEIAMPLLRALENPNRVTFAIIRNRRQLMELSMKIIETFATTEFCEIEQNLQIFAESN